MRGSKDLLNDLQALQRALLALSEDLDQIERRPHWSLRIPSEALPPDSKGLEQAISNFAFAMARCAEPSGERTTPADR